MRMAAGPITRSSALWEEAVEFCHKLSARPQEQAAGRSYRLPTEAEWEYACREAGALKTPFHFGAKLGSEQANFDGNCPYGGADKGPWLHRTTPVGSYKPNAFGLFDMHGNVWEWCQDWYDDNYYSQSPRQDPQGPQNGSYRVLRGGSWFNDGCGCRSAIRDKDSPKTASATSDSGSVRRSPAGGGTVVAGAQGYAAAHAAAEAASAERAAEAALAHVLKGIDDEDEDTERCLLAAERAAGSLPAGRQRLPARRRARRTGIHRRKACGQGVRAADPGKVNRGRSVG